MLRIGALAGAAVLVTLAAGCGGHTVVTTPTAGSTPTSSPAPATGASAPRPAGVGDTLEVADEFLLEGDKQPHRRLNRAQFLELMAARAAAGGAGRERDDE